MTAIIDGSAIADKKLKELTKLINGRPIHLAAIVLGRDEGVQKFVKIKKTIAESIGVNFSSYEFLEEASEREVLETIQFLNADPAVHGIFIELPVPAKYNQQKILDEVAPSKDVDVLTDVLQKQFYSDTTEVLPPAVGALSMVMKELSYKIKGKKVAVFGQGMLIGKPISHWLRQQGAEVFAIDIETKNPEQLSREADLVISGVGKPGLITEGTIKDDAIVIDFGYTIKKGKIFGDADLVSVVKKASAVTPVPGGMGPLVIVAALENLISQAGY